MQGDRIKEVMENRSLTKADLCRLIVAKGHKVTEQAIGKWLSGATQNIKGEYFYAIEDATGYSARWLIEGKLPKVKNNIIKSSSNWNTISTHPLEQFKELFDSLNDESKKMVVTFLRAIEISNKDKNEIKDATNNRIKRR